MHSHMSHKQHPVSIAGDHTGLSRPCYFIDKAYHAQMAGADALLVVNDNPGDLSTAVAPKDEDSTRCAWSAGFAKPQSASARWELKTILQQILLLCK